MFTVVDTLEHFNKIKEQNQAVLFYFSHEKCNVCRVLKPKIMELIASFPKIELYYCDTEKSPEIAAQNSVFAVPTLLTFFMGKETIRKSRNLSIDELRGELERSYGLLFN